MPAPDSLRPHTETLANGLRVTLRHVPGLKRSAAVLRVAAGSHDAPLAWPGLAHLLEHLFFLGTERFPAGENLMAYVQRHGGQVNARTSERTTDFFFELPPATFAEGLERLGDMLTHPRLDEADQLREREVLHAEFIAWSQDAAAQRQLALHDGLSATHPLRGFHAGNRDSLAVAQSEFQSALHDFYRRFYQSGQMTLSLAGPQSIDALKALAEQFGRHLPGGEALARPAPPSLMASSPTSYQQAREGCLDLLFAFEDLPAASPQALDFLCMWLNSSKPGGLLATLRQRGLADSLKATALYEFAGQALLHIEVKHANALASAQIQPLLHDWLGFFAAQDDWAPLRQEFTALLQRRQETGSALQVARWDGEGRDGPLLANDLVRLREILRQLHPADNVVEPWQLPTPNPFLQTPSEAPRAGLIRGQTSAHRGLRTFAQDRSRGRRERSPMQFSQALPDNGREGAVYLRWQLATQTPQDFQSRLDRHLQDVREDARQAGVDVSFQSSGNQWLLKLVGLQAPIPLVLEHVLTKLAQPLPMALASQEPPPMPIRHLLKALPDHCHPNRQASALPMPDSDQSVWTTARWDGLCIGLSAATQGPLGPALARVPGIAGDEASLAPAPRGQRLWHTLQTHGEEPAVLLFCPTATPTLADEAAWRLLAQLCQTPFYQRLRVELQLGYAVFSGLKQIDGQTGILFGVQSPSLSATQLSAHIEQFLAGLPTLLQQLDDVSLTGQQQALAAQLQSTALPCAQAAELLWQGKLAGHPSDYLEQLSAAIVYLDRTQLQRAAQRLIEAEGGWYCLSNGACPGERWQAPQ
ncbi:MULTISPECIES: pyrroloquinoline quinone biosynthesis protein PqqF [unclassified Pseudomonas]|uniref:pyrroloquinoline quinone biosynthesis protein PqqF n=1 Tax=unclassified Pseudomonas TaxID=196821 RepID=UPI0008770F82|nr:MULTISPECIES: pyrroloquinoline quinone biosynthesis protein PqqF [unclassified Pseudomonas]SCZ34239.1 coenzyme PQQ biosynthesis probable peptidase PqqF [Pseudomonas sp. NFACC44-2]SDA59091.1 coenzyme PQQ biosynthesis probable peptidase PqqF [Pseudomonas sp. NFACC51]SEJ61772.1 coenzyme PQQ biosynthesis probable peptidase PqqF [Pseudomonas sp. NFACC07-1]SFH71508.1 coenzyme PQQ biosynthesis probable peptidase PqqF [Pseudomonas sp. NFACC54]SFS68487.1 coenzyme PQQ biosynthesis probable peptidase 